jgi:hypothetical protein
VNWKLAERFATELRETLGPPGRMIARSKSGFRRANPDEAVVWNANVCLAGPNQPAAKVWAGDVSLSLDERKLVALAARTGMTAYLLPEYAARWRYEDKPRLEQRVYSVTASGEIGFDGEWLHRAADGTLRTRH